MRSGRLGRLAVFSSVLFGLMMLLPVTSAGVTVPSAYLVEGVPLYQQIDAKGCGAASLQMVFDYYGPFIEQMEIYDAARSGGTALPDMARAAQFSSMSTTAGDRYILGITTGYTARDVGYAGFYYAATDPWLDGLKSIVSQGYPVVVLVDWLPDLYGPHYRVVVGYDDVAGVMKMNDPWSREFKNDMDYVGSSSQSANPNAWDLEFGTFDMTYADFLDVWSLPTTIWGVPDLAYGAVFVTPWEVDLTVPESVKADKKFTVTADITYPCLAPFGSDSFPMFPASDLLATLTVSGGLSIVGDAFVEVDGVLAAGGKIAVSWTVKAPSDGGEYSLSVDASGIVSGSLGEWKDYPAYDYTDVIGGSTSASVLVGS